MEITFRKPQALKGASYNPKARVEKSRLKDLTESIKRVGIMYPVLVTSDGVIIDGHRRTTAAVLLGLPTVPVMVVKQDPESVYAEVNGATRPFSSAEKMAVYLDEPRAVTTRSRNSFAAMESVMGKDGMRELVRRGLSQQTYRQARQVAAYCGDMSDTFVKSSCLWIARQRMAYLVRKAMEEGVAPEILATCVNADQPLSYKWGAA